MQRAWSLFLLVLLFVSCAFTQDDEEREPHDTMYDTPKPSGPVVFLETFNDDHWTRTWFPSTDPKYSGDWKVEESEQTHVSGDRGLIVNSVAKHHGIAALFPEVLDNTDKDLVVQYEVQLQHGLDCGGAYIKLLTAKPDLDVKTSDYEYTIMFGPDKCGSDDKLHFIIRHENPKSHVVEEKHLVPRPKIKTDKLTHLYTLHVRKDNSFEILIDQQVVKAGNLLEDFNPAINPPTEIDDPEDFKPADWADDEIVPDPDARKPDDWDEEAPFRIPDPTDTKPEDWLDDAPETIPDPKFTKPADWNDEEDGEWVAPQIENPACIEHGCGKWEPRLIRNPDYKGKWSAPNIKNPKYVGPWKARQISNPYYFEDHHPHNFPKMAGVAFELWTMNDGILFDNILITYDRAVADDFAKNTWAVKNAKEKAKHGVEDPTEAGEGLVETLKQYGNLIYNSMRENPYIVAAAVVAGIVPLFICSFFTPPPRKPSVPTKTTVVRSETATEVSQETDSTIKTTKKEKVVKKEDNEEEDEIQPDEPVKKSPVVRKRKVPRASD